MERGSQRGLAIAAIYLTGLGQGACFVTFPALGNIFKIALAPAGKIR